MIFGIEMETLALIWVWAWVCWAGLILLMNAGKGR
jgi:hypothetical protein